MQMVGREDLTRRNLNAPPAPDTKEVSLMKGIYEALSSLYSNADKVDDFIGTQSWRQREPSPVSLTGLRAVIPVTQDSQP